MIVLFLPLLTASNWVNLTGVQPISNITTELIELRSGNQVDWLSPDLDAPPVEPEANA